MSGAEWNVLIGVGGLIMTIGLVSVLFHFGVFKYPKKWNDELQDHYIPKILQPKKETEDSDNEKRDNDDQQ
ncbi:MAG: hypothetical protein NC489_08480 [Ruminococcus flavefaciens]|nr:hypothetical protein [Ruminococcus flavefaciens]